MVTLRTSLLVAMAVMASVEWVDAKGYEWIVDPRLIGCCGDEFDTSCNAVDSITKGQDGFHYIFLRSVVIKAKFSDKGFPEVRKGWTTQDSAWFGNFSKGVPIKAKGAFLLGNQIEVKRGDRFYTYSKPGVLSYTSGDCKEHHDLFCRKDVGLIGVSSSALRAQRGDQIKEREEIQAYYFNAKSKNYLQVNYLGNDSQPQSEVQTPITTMTSITFYDEELKVFDDIFVSHGLVFNEEGYACPFNLYEDEDVVNPLEGPMHPQMHCLPVQVFLGCPQSWCFRTDVDDILLSGSLSPGEREKLIVYRGLYHWEAEPIVPLPVPPVGQMVLLDPSNGENSKKLAFIDAIFEVDEGSYRRFLVVIKGTQVFIYDDTMASGTARKLYNVFPKINEPLLHQDSSDSVDAAFYSTNHNVVLLFVGGAYIIYGIKTVGISDGNNGQTIKFYHIRTHSLAEDFPGLPSHIDGAVALDGDVYIFKENFVYQGKEDHLLYRVFRWFPQLSWYDATTSTGFFLVDDLCPHTMEQMALIKSLLKPPRAAETRMIIESRWKRVPDASLPLIIFLILLFFFIFGCFNQIRKDCFGRSPREKQEDLDEEEMEESKDRAASSGAGVGKDGSKGAKDGAKSEKEVVQRVKSEPIERRVEPEEDKVSPNEEKSEPEEVKVEPNEGKDKASDEPSEGSDDLANEVEEPSVAPINESAAAKRKREAKARGRFAGSTFVKGVSAPQAHIHPKAPSS